MYKESESRLAHRMVDAYRTPLKTDPEIDKTRPLTVALYGSVTPWREAFTESDVGDRTVEWFDPRDEYLQGSPDHYVRELEHFSDDIRVFVVLDETTSFGTLMELAHALEVKLHSHTVVHIAPHMDESVGTKTERDKSNFWRARLIEMLDQYSYSEFVHVVDSVEDAALVASALLDQWQ